MILTPHLFQARNRPNAKYNLSLIQTELERDLYWDWDKLACMILSGSFHIAI